MWMDPAPGKASARDVIVLKCFVNRLTRLRGLLLGLEPIARPTKSHM